MNCSSGEKVTGGGGKLDAGVAGTLRYSSPTATGWAVAITNTGSAESSATVFAQCAAP